MVRFFSRNDTSVTRNYDFPRRSKNFASIDIKIRLRKQRFTHRNKISSLKAAASILETAILLPEARILFLATRIFLPNTRTSLGKSSFAPKNYILFLETIVLLLETEFGS